MPESVQGLIAARLDALTDDEKSLIQDASVIGKVFWLGAMAAASGEDDRSSLQERLHNLERKRFIQRERRSSVEGDTEYAFAHTLVRDVAYSQITRAGRAEKHRRAAAWIESLGRPEEYAELRAHHYASALEAARAGGQEIEELAGAARLALREAGDRAASLNAFAVAARHYDRALESWPDDAARPRLLLAAAGARFEVDLANHEELAAARDALLATGDRKGAAEAEIRIVNVHWVHGRGEEALRHLERAAALAEPLPPSAEKAFVYSSISRFHSVADRDEPARAFAEEAVAMAEELGLEAVRADALTTLGTISCAQGDRRGLRQLEESIAILEPLNSPRLNRAYNNLLFARYRFGEFEGMEEVIAKHLAAAERVGSGEWHRWAKGRELDYLYVVGRWDDAMEIADNLIGGLAEGEQHYTEGEWRISRSRIRLARGDDVGADEDAAVAVERSHAARDPQGTIPSLAWRSRQLLPSDRAGSVAAADELLAICRTMAGDTVHLWLSDAAVALTALGRDADFEELVERFSPPTPWLDGGIALARGEYAAAAETFSAMGATAPEAEARLLSAKAGIDAELPKAIEFFRQVGASAYLAEAEALLATSRSA